MDALTITGQVVRGFIDGQADVVRRYLKDCEGQMVSFVITPKGAKRSAAQNALLWGALYPQVLERLLLETGYEPEEARSKHHQLQAHYGLLSLHYGTTLDRVSKQEVPTKTSSELTPKQFSEHVAWVIRHASKEYGIVVEGIE